LLLNRRYHANDAVLVQYPLPGRYWEPLGTTTPKANRRLCTPTSPGNSHFLVHSAHRPYPATFLVLLRAVSIAMDEMKDKAEALSQGFIAVGAELGQNAKVA